MLAFIAAMDPINIISTANDLNHSNRKRFHSFIFNRWDEMGYYDIPACINYVLKETGASKLVYIGHSMGTAIFWVAMITHPELNSKIDVMIALAPAASVANVKSLVKFTAPFINPIEVIPAISFIVQSLFFQLTTKFHFSADSNSPLSSGN